MSMKFYNIRLNTILTSGSVSELVRVVVSPKWPAPFSRLSKDWTPMIRNESNTMSMNTQWQWFIFDQLQFIHAAMPVYWSLLLFPQTDCPKWLHHLGRLSKEWTPTLCDVIVVWPWLQCQRKFVSAECNTFSFDWRNHMTKDLRTDRNQTSVNAE